MKNIKHFIIISLSIFFLLTIGISSWYILSLNYLEKYDLKKVVKIVTQIGLVGALTPSLTISFIFYFIIKIKNKLSLLFLIISLIIFLMFQIYWITLNLFFYEISSSKSFLRSLLESFQ